MTERDTITCPDEDEIKLALMGSDSEQTESLARLWNYFSPRLIAFVEKRLPTLPSDLAANAVLDCFRELFDSVRDGTFDFDKPMAPFLFTVAHRRAVDELRAIRSRALGNADFYESVAEMIEGTGAGCEWQKLVQAGKARSVADKFRAFVMTLPSVQRQVGQVMADYLPDDLTRDEVCDEIYKRTGKRPTVIQVKSALGQIRQKFRELMSKD
jgi:DNA-directed RNA polymerase specialized sigma24 family protein